MHFETACMIAPLPDGVPQARLCAARHESLPVSLVAGCLRAQGSGTMGSVAAATCRAAIYAYTTTCSHNWVASMSASPGLRVKTWTCACACENRDTCLSSSHAPLCITSTADLDSLETFYYFLEILETKIYFQFYHFLLFFFVDFSISSFSCSLIQLCKSIIFCETL